MTQNSQDNHLGRSPSVLFPKACLAGRAHNTVCKAIVDGTLVRPTECEQCYIECKPDGHHPDYTKPLEVIWLCNKCHKKAHAEEWAEDRRRRKALLRH